MLKQNCLLGAFIITLIVAPLFPQPFPSSTSLPLPGAYNPYPASSEDARQVLVNPAGAAGFELPRYTLALGGLFPKTTYSEMGAVAYISGAAVYPLSFGVLWGGIEGHASPKLIPEMKSDEGMSLSTGISKRLGDTFYAGLGLTAFAWGMGFSLGFQQDFPNLGSGGSSLFGSIINVGNGTETPYPFTIVTGWKTLLFTNPVEIAGALQLASPAFQEFLIQPSGTITLGNILTLSLNWNLALFNGEMNSLFPAISLALKWSEQGFIPRFRVQPVWSQGIGIETAVTLSRGEKDRQGPAIELAKPLEMVYSAKTRPFINLDILIKDDGPIKTWELSIQDEQGLSRFTKSDPQPKNTALVRVPISIPLDTTWPDGEYRLFISAQDIHGNESTRTLSFNVDSTPPQATLIADTIFSPNGDGVRDLLKILQSGTKEDLWTGTIQNKEGIPVRTYSWEAMSPPEFVWDGRDNTGTVVSDGTYTYTLSSIDMGGNSITTTTGPIYVDAKPRRLQISLSSGAMSTEPSSPFGTIQARFSDYILEGLTNWTIKVVNAQGDSFRSWLGSRDRLDQFPSILQFNGLSDQKEPIPDGTYRFEVSMEYTNGDTLIQRSPFFTVQSQKPAGLVRASRSSLSFNNNEGITLYHDLSPEAEWRGFIRDANQHIIKSFNLGRNTEAVVPWQGDTDSGQLAEAGTYSYVAEGINSVGLTGRTNPIRIVVEPLQKGTLLLQSSAQLFSSRSGEGRVLFTPRYQDIGTITNYQFTIRNTQSGAVVKEDTGTLPGTFNWDGRDSLGILSPDGSYQAQLRLALAKGSILSATSQPIILDATPPQAKVTAEPVIFSPNGDGKQDAATFTIGADGGNQWTGSVITSDGRVIKSFNWKGNPPASIIWDGTDDGNSHAPDGTYRFRLEGLDLAGNRTVVESTPVTLDARRPAATITSDLTAFSPNKDGFADSVKIRLVSAFTDGLAHFIVEIRDRNGTRVRRLTEGTHLDQSAQFLWDGSLDDGLTIALDGEYTPWAQLEYAKGDQITLSGKAIRLDRTPPNISISLGPQPFSPDGDGVNDVLSIKLSAEDASEINGWKLSILDPAGSIFTSFSGKTLPPEPILWDGYNLNNELVEAAQEYSYIVQVRDVLGNMATKTGSLSTDVFVIKDGDRLKIRISSIVFPPNSSNLFGMDNETNQRNRAILDRLAEVLKKYGSYRIRIEGHGVNLSGTEREERTELEALSLDRARAVMAALVERGIEKNRLEAKGLGGREPLVPHTDEANRWKNRRVEFILMR